VKALNYQFLKKFNDRLIRHFLDVLILMELKDGFLSGYDVIALVHREFGTLLSAGSVYSCLSSLEREGLISGDWVERKRMYRLTDKGKEVVAAISASKDVVLNLVNRIFS